MSYQLICDGGCGASTENSKDFEERGLEDKKQYCKDCIKVIDTFIDERNKIHDKIQDIWKTDTKKLIEKFYKENPDAKLPD